MPLQSFGIISKLLLHKSEPEKFGKGKEKDSPEIAQSKGFSETSNIKSLIESWQIYGKYLNLSPVV